MAKNARNWLALMLGVFALSGCELASNDVAIKATVLSVGKKHLVVQDKGSVMFLTINETDRPRLKKLKKGEAITILGTKVEGSEHSVDVVEIVTAKGEHIPLGEQ